MMKVNVNIVFFIIVSIFSRTDKNRLRRTRANDQGLESSVFYQSPGIFVKILVYDMISIMPSLSFRSNRWNNYGAGFIGFVFEPTM